MNLTKGSDSLLTTLARLALVIRPSLRGRVFALLAGLTICACAGATATYWLARHYLDATDVLRQVNLGQQVSAVRLSEQLWALESEALAARQDHSRREQFEKRLVAVTRTLLIMRASEPLEAGRGLAESRPGEGAGLVARAARHRQQAQEEATALFALHGRDADLGVQSMRSLAKVATTGSLLAIPAGAVLGLLLGWVLLRQVLGPIRRLALGAVLAPISDPQGQGGGT